MSLDWPNTVTSRHRHLRKRAEAYASAMYYSECSLSGISPDGAAVAEEITRSRCSRWWLKGNDPDHPSHGSAAVKDAASTSCDANENTTPVDGDATHGELIQPDDENDVGIVDNQEEDERPLDDDSNLPIMAQDDDWGSSFGNLSNFRSDGNPSLHAPTNISATQSVSSTIVRQSSLLPSWMSPSSTTPFVSPPQVSRQEDQGSIEEMLNSYHNSNPTHLLTQEQKKDPPESLASVAQVTSESEADDSSYSRSSVHSCKDSGVFYPKPRFQYVEAEDFACRPRSRKRDRNDFSIPLDQTFLKARVKSAKAELLSRLENEGTGPAFNKALASLEKYSKLLKSSSCKKRKSNTHSINESTDIDGTWLMASPPDYPSCLGKNCHGESVFTLGRMSFDMYQPSSLICSIQKQYNTIKSVDTKDLPMYVPKSLRREVESERSGKGAGRLKTYNIIASFTIESTDDESKKLRGILTNYGYALPDPSTPDRKSIWFTGGTIEPADDNMLEEWKRIFGSTSVNIGPSELSTDDADADSKPSPAEAEKARSIASKILLGAVHEPMDEQGIVGFHLNKPIGGHGSAFCDIVYMDEDVRIMRGHSGSIYVFKRV